MFGCTRNLRNKRLGLRMEKPAGPRMKEQELVGPHDQEQNRHPEIRGPSVPHTRKAPWKKCPNSQGAPKEFGLRTHHGCSSHAIQIQLQTLTTDHQKLRPLILLFPIQPFTISISSTSQAHLDSVYFLHLTCNYFCPFHLISTRNPIIAS